MASKKNSEELREATRVLVDTVRDLIGDSRGDDSCDMRFWPRPPTNIYSLSYVIDDLREALRVYDEVNAEAKEVGR
jgi:hypothetical protein